MATVPVVDFIGDNAEKRGDTLDYDLTFTGVDVQQPGTQIWFTGKTNKAHNDSQAVWQKTIGAGVTVTGPSTATATLVPTDTAGLTMTNEKATVYYDAEVKTPTGRVQTVVEGRIEFTVDITNTA